ncbi:hypothetical protein [Mycolicibacterium sp. P1-5]|uniref:hypothetical protein n=1 Tax=Mycolicibacterium sp. P1-5 TaxID=2024617 RepID=UPI0011EBB460|nr:hypothetical protein [Mycolicibacterium sp. P1-5]
MDDSEIEAFEQPTCPPSILFGGAALMIVLVGIVVSVLRVSAASVDIHHLSPRPPVQHAATIATTAPVAPGPAAQNGLEEFVNDLTPRLPGLDRVLQAP